MASTFIKLPVDGGSGPAPGVDSFNGRTGVVVSQAGDYAAGIISNTPAGGIAATNVQAAINELDSEKQATITGAATTIVSSNLTADRAVISNGSGKVAVSAITSTEVNYLSGVTSAIQTQLTAKQASDAELDAIAALATNGLIAKTGAGTAATRTITGSSSVSVANGDGVAANPTLSLPASGVTPGTYTLSQVTVNDRGIVTAVSNGIPTEQSIDTYLIITDDFTGGTVSTGSYAFTVTSSGLGAQSVTGDTTFVNTTGRAIGVARIESGTAVTARSTVHTGLTSFATGYCAYDFQCRATLNSIGTVGDTYEATFGFIDNSGAAPQHVDGVYFRFFGDGVNTNWECVTSNASVRTTVTTSTPVLVNNLIIFQIIINEAGTEAQFYVNGVLVATINTNLPTGANLFGMGAKMAKIAGAVIEYNMFIDWIQCKATYSAPRG